MIPMNASIESSPTGRQPRNYRLRLHLTRLLLLSSALWCLGCQGPRTAGVPSNTAVASSGVLAPGDTLRISFTGARQHDLAQRIRPDGKISLPLVGEVRAAGRTVGALQADLSSRYKTQLQDSEVVVILDGSAAAVYVTGAVNRPSKIPLDRPMTALEAVMEAGGFAPGLANTKKVLLVRNNNGRQYTHTLDLSPALSQASSAPVFLRPYDMLYVQERFF